MAPMPTHVMAKIRESKAEKQRREKKEAKVPESAHEKELKARLHEVEELMHMKTGRGGAEDTQSYFDGSVSQHSELEKEYHTLRKQIKAERERALECYEAAKGVAAEQNSISSWAEKVMDQGRFNKEPGTNKESIFTAQSAGLMTKQEYANKRKEAEADLVEATSHPQGEGGRTEDEIERKFTKDRAQEQKAKKRAKAKAASLLSFNEDDEEEGS